MYTIYGDESYDEKQERVFAVGTVFGTQPQWADLQKNWLKRTCGIVIHAAQLESDRGYFESFPHDENLRLYRDLITIVADSEIRGSAVALDIREFKTLFPGAVKAQAYLHCFNEALIGCQESIAPSEAEDLEVVFDQHPENETAAGLLYASFVSDESWRSLFVKPGRISFDDHRRFIGLQVADMVARETMKAIDNRQLGMPRKTRGSMLALDATERFLLQYFTGEYLVSIKQFIENNPEMQAGLAAYREWIEEKGITDSAAMRLTFAARRRREAERNKQ